MHKPLILCLEKCVCLIPRILNMIFEVMYFNHK